MRLALCTRRWLLIAAIALFVAPLVLGTSSTSVSSSSPAQEEVSCAWKSLGRIGKGVFYPASAVDTDNNIMYFYGGMDDTDYAVQSSVTSITFGDSFDLSGTRASRVPVSGALPRMALGGAYRPHGDESAVYYIGGRDDSAASSTVQVYKIETGGWSRISPGGSFSSRDEHASAYDPIHDVIWVIAGERQPCESVPCTPPIMPTNYLSFDDDTGIAHWHEGPSGGLNRAKGPTMVYDSRGKRMIAFGGTRDGARGTNELWALDVSDPDIEKASWIKLSAGGGPSVVVHSAAYHPLLNWMIVYGGVRNNYAVLGNEGTETRTWALDLNGETPAWRNLNTTMGDRVQSVMGYIPKHQAMVLTAGREAIDDPPQAGFNNLSINGLVCTGGPAEETPTPTATETPTGVPPTPTATSTVIDRATETSTPTDTMEPTDTPTPTEAPPEPQIYLPDLSNN